MISCSEHEHIMNENITYTIFSNNVIQAIDPICQDVQASNFTFGSIAEGGLSYIASFWTKLLPGWIVLGCLLLASLSHCCFLKRLPKISENMSNILMIGSSISYLLCAFFAFRYGRTIFQIFWNSSCVLECDRISEFLLDPSIRSTVDTAWLIFNIIQLSLIIIPTILFSFLIYNKWNKIIIPITNLWIFLILTYLAIMLVIHYLILDIQPFLSINNIIKLAIDCIGFPFSSEEILLYLNTLASLKGGINQVLDTHSNSTFPILPAFTFNSFSSSNLFNLSQFNLNGNVNQSNLQTIITEIFENPRNLFKETYTFGDIQLYVNLNGSTSHIFRYIPHQSSFTV